MRSLEAISALRRNRPLSAGYRRVRVSLPFKTGLLPTANRQCARSVSGSEISISEPVWRRLGSRVRGLVGDHPTGSSARSNDKPHPVFDAHSQAFARHIEKPKCVGCKRNGFWPISGVRWLTASTKLRGLLHTDLSLSKRARSLESARERIWVTGCFFGERHQAGRVSGQDPFPG